MQNFVFHLKQDLTFMFKITVKSRLQKVIVRLFGFSILWACISLSHVEAQRPTAKPLTDSLKAQVARYAEAAQDRSQRGDYKESSRFLNEIALIYWEAQQFDKAITYFRQSVAENQKVNNIFGISRIYNNVGTLYADLEQYDSAYTYFNQSLGLRRRLRDKMGIVTTTMNLGVVLNNLKRYPESIKFLEEGLRNAQELSDPELMKGLYASLAETYDKMGDREKSNYYFSLYRTFNDLVNRNKEAKAQLSLEQATLRAQLAEAMEKAKAAQLEETEGKLNTTQGRLYQFDAKNQELLRTSTKQELLIRSLNAEKALADAELESKKRQIFWERIILALAGLILLVMVVLGVVLYRNYRAKKRINIQLNQQNNEIREQQVQIIQQKASLQQAYTEISHYAQNVTDSIRYAERIQAAMLGNAEELNVLFPGSFLFWQPKDIISGDFYWIKRVGNQVLIAAADCTGHGVPGAMMSMLGYNLLEGIVDDGYLEPADLLNQLNIRIQQRLNKEQTDNKDGMDIALIKINLLERTLTYAGAKNPVLGFALETGKGENLILKAQKVGVGTYDPMLYPDVKYLQQVISLDYGVQLYLFTDGYEDQIGGPHNRRLMTRGFYRILEEISGQPPEQQLLTLKTKFNDWKGPHGHQLDDILILGLRLEPQRFPLALTSLPAASTASTLPVS